MQGTGEQRGASQSGPGVTATDRCTMRQSARHTPAEKWTRCASREARHRFLKLGLQGEEASMTQRSCHGLLPLLGRARGGVGDGHWT